jgi:hypothetical protein
MRRPVALVLFAMFPAALALACGSTPTEREETNSEAIVSCPAGEHPYCDTNEVTGKLFCRCVQNTCSYAPPATPPPPGDVAWIAAWASPRVNGTCPVITTPTGRWAEIGDVIGPTATFAYANGVPDDGSLYPLTPSDCSHVPGMGSSCCTYVWWPNGYPAQVIDLPMQDTQDLCPVNGATLVPIEQVAPIVSQGSADAGGPLPGNGGCGSCVPVMQ